MSEMISFRGDKAVWDRFVENVKVSKKEVWQVLKPFVEANSRFDFNKVNEFVNGALNEYSATRMIDKLVATKEAAKPDSTFFEIRNGGFVEEAFLRPDEGRIHISPIIHGIGHSIAMGEVDHLAKLLVDSEKSFESKKVKSSDIDISFLSNEASTLVGDSTVLLPTNLMERIFKDSYRRMERKDRLLVLDNNIKIDFIHEDIIGNRVFMIGEFGCLWLYVKKDNPITEKPEILHIDIGDYKKENKISILAKSVSKLNIMPKEIKVYTFDFK